MRKSWPLLFGVILVGGAMIGAYFNPHLMKEPAFTHTAAESSQYFAGGPGVILIAASQG
jgi:hypothetical protein